MPKPEVKNVLETATPTYVGCDADLQAALKAANYTGRPIRIPESLVQLAQVRAAMAERERVVSILQLSKPGFEKQIQSAIEDGTSAERVAFVILREIQNRGITLDAIRNDSPAAAARGVPSIAAASSWDPAVNKLKASQQAEQAAVRLRSRGA